MFDDVVLYSNRLREAGYRLGYVGKWHASQVRGPLDFGFDEIADLKPPGRPAGQRGRQPGQRPAAEEAGGGRHTPVFVAGQPAV